MAVKTKKDLRIGTRQQRERAKALSRAIGNFNAKITRLSKKDPSLVDYLPQRLSSSTENFVRRTAADVNDRLRYINNFIKTDIKPVTTPTGVKTTNFEAKELRLQINRVNRDRAKELKRLAPSLERGNRHLIEDLNLMPKTTNIEAITPRNWRSFLTTTTNQARPSYREQIYINYKNNYIKGLRNEFGSRADDLIEKINLIPPARFTALYYENTELDIDFIYGAQSEDFRLRKIRERLNQINI